MTKNNKPSKSPVAFLVGIGILGVICFLAIVNLKTYSPSLTTDHTSPTVAGQKVTLVGKVKQLDNNSDPAQYSYELALNFPFYDDLSYPVATVDKMPILSRDKDQQESIKSYVGKEVALEGVVAWGQGESRYLEISSITDMNGWNIYTNKTFGYSFKFPTSYQVLVQSAKQISQVGLDNNMVIQKKSDSNGTDLIIVDVSTNGGSSSIRDYMNSNSKEFGIDGPLLDYSFNGYNSILNKNQLGTNVFVKNGKNIFHITAATASTNKEIGIIVSTFKFTR